MATTSLYPHVNGARFSEDRRYRYMLWRRWGRGPLLMVIGLNPSTADETQDDPTVRRCARYAKDWGYDGLLMTNIFAFRATDPAVMKAERSPIGPDNDNHLVYCARNAGFILAAWGNHGIYLDRGRRVYEMLATRGGKLHTFKITGQGQPIHPLYQPLDAVPVLWEP